MAEDLDSRGVHNVGTRHVHGTLLQGILRGGALPPVFPYMEQKSIFIWTTSGREQSTSSQTCCRWICAAPSAMTHRRGRR